MQRPGGAAPALESEPAAEAERLERLILWNAPAAPVAIVALAALYWFYPGPALPVLIVVVAPVMIIQPIALRYARRHEIETAATLLSAAMWLPALALAILTPELWTLTVLVSLMSVLVSLPYVRPRRLFALLCAAVGLIALGGVARLDPLFPVHVLPPLYLDYARTLGAFVLGFLCLVAVRQYNDRLRATLDDTQAANEALRESERTLEGKVAERTADLVQSERELALARDEALAANRAKSAFLANMSHELRTPLNAIIGYSEMLQEEAREVGQDEMIPDLDKVLQAGHHLLGLINDVLDLSKVEAGKLELLVERLDVRELVESTRATVQPLIERRRNTFEVSDLSAVGGMRSDGTRLRQILFNLLSNAAKFTNEGTIRLEVTRESAPEGDWLEFRVSDTGIGMTPAQLETVFEAFAQAQAATSRDFGGTGLGLAITRRFCQLLGGDVSATSEPGEGSRFSVRLPAVAPVPMDAPSPVIARGRTASPVSPVSSRASADSAAPASPTVLVIDDDAAARELLERHLERSGFRVVTCESGHAGIQLAHELRPDVITLDIRMPGLDGWSVLSTLKADPELADVPVILVTVTEDRDLGFALGASDFLTKPVDPSRLSSVLRRVAGRSEEQPVLVIEDDPATRELLCRSLRAQGWRVVEAGNGREGLERVATEAPALILLDLVLPELSGFEFLDRLRTYPEWRDIPVVVITASDLSQSERARLTAETERVLQKGAYRREDLVAEVRALVESRQRDATHPSARGDR